WIDQALALPGEVPVAARRSALVHHAVNLLAVDRYDEARARYAAAVALDAAGPHPLIPLFLTLDGMFHGDQDQIALAMPSVLDHPDPWVRAVGLGVRGRWRHETGDPDGADRDTKDALDALRATGDRWAMAIILSLSADACGLRG